MIKIKMGTGFSIVFVNNEWEIQLKKVNTETDKLYNVHLKTIQSTVDILIDTFNSQQYLPDIPSAQAEYIIQELGGAGRIVQADTNKHVPNRIY